MEYTGRFTVKTMPKHLVYSLDFDGCTDTETSRHVLAQLISQIAKNIPELQSLTYLIGSLRQYLDQDIFNAVYNAPHHEGMEQSCTLLEDAFDELVNTELRQRLSSLCITFNRFLAGDLYNNLTPGTTFQKMQEYAVNSLMFNPYVKNKRQQTLCLLPEQNKFKLPESNSFVDCTKVSTLYMQMQFMAEQYPSNDDFTFIFVDDREDILNNLHQVYKLHSQLIPKNCRLELVQYDSNGCYNDRLFMGIQGRGELNESWQSDLLSIPDKFSDPSVVHLENPWHRYLIEELLVGFKPVTTPKPTSLTFFDKPSTRAITPMTPDPTSSKYLFRSISTDDDHFFLNFAKK